MIRCRRCGEDKPEDAFHQRANGVRCWCSVCESAYAKAKRRPSNKKVGERPMPPERRDVSSPKICGACQSTIFNGTDGDGYATLTCRCGTIFAPVYRPASHRRYDAGEQHAAATAKEVAQAQRPVVEPGHPPMGTEGAGHPWNQRKRGKPDRMPTGLYRNPNKGKAA